MRRRSSESADGPTGPHRCFVVACERAGIPPEQWRALWAAHSGANGKHGVEVEAVLADHAEWTLFECARRGDASAARRFERSWRQRARRALGRQFSVQEVDELVAAFFHRVWERVPSRFDWQCPFEAYLRSVLVNLARDWQRRAVRRRGREAPEPIDEHGRSGLERARGAEPNPEESLLAAERRRQLGEAFAGLSKDERLVLVGALVEGLSGEEAAKRLGIQRQAYYMRLHRAKASLKDRLVELGLDRGSDCPRHGVRSPTDSRPSGKRGSSPSRQGEGRA